MEHAPGQEPAAEDLPGSPPDPEECQGRTPRQEMLHLLAAVREHLDWLREGGVPGVPQGPPARPAQLPRAPQPGPPPPGSPSPGPAAPAPGLRSPPPVAVAPAIARPAPPPPARPVVVYPELPSPLPKQGKEGLDLVRDVLGDCQRCKLCRSRNTLVFGQGDPEARLVFVGEGPGAEEDRTGLAFVGAAGDLLTRMIAAMGLRREQVYICNVVKCRPPGNRTPEPDETAACSPFLRGQIQAIRPRVIVALGRTPAQFLLNTPAPISKLRGRFSSWEGIPVMPTFHPAYLLRTPSAKRQVWEDLQMVMTLLKQDPAATAEPA